MTTDTFERVPGWPYPNDKIGEATVVASIVINDDDSSNVFHLVLLLNPTVPFFTVAEVEGPEHTINWSNDHLNIVPAVAEYVQSGGDY